MQCLRGGVEVAERTRRQTGAGEVDVVVAVVAIVLLRRLKRTGGVGVVGGQLR